MSKLKVKLKIFDEDEVLKFSPIEFSKWCLNSKKNIKEEHIIKTRRRKSRILSIL